YRWDRPWGHRRRPERVGATGFHRLSSELAERCDIDAGALADPVRIGAELGMDVQLVRLVHVAGPTQRPATDRVDQRVLDVLGDLSGDVLRALGPLLDPPPPFGDGVLEGRDSARAGELPRLEVVQDQGACEEQRVVGTHENRSWQASGYDWCTA